jgi:hypothetical protein
MLLIFYLFFDVKNLILCSITNSHNCRDWFIDITCNFRKGISCIPCSIMCFFLLSLTFSSKPLFFFLVLLNLAQSLLIILSLLLSTSLFSLLNLNLSLFSLGLSCCSLLLFPFVFIFSCFIGSFFGNFYLKFLFLSF